MKKRFKKVYDWDYFKINFIFGFITIILGNIFFLFLNDIKYLQICGGIFFGLCIVGFVISLIISDEYVEV